MIRQLPLKIMESLCILTYSLKEISVWSIFSPFGCQKKKKSSFTSNKMIPVCRHKFLACGYAELKEIQRV